MKKHLIAAAVAAAVAVPAMAQVTVSGVLDAAARSTNTSTTNAVLGGAATSVKTEGDLSATEGDGWSTSQLVFTATEDLGGGLKLTALGSARLGQTGSAVGSRDRHITLQGGFGLVRVGRFAGTIDGQNGFSGAGTTGTPGAINTFSTGATGRFFSVDGVNTVAIGGIGMGGSYERNNNHVAYTSPTIAGFSASVGFTKDKTSTTGLLGATADKMRYASLGYAAGPLTVALASGSRKNSTIGAAAVNQIGNESDMDWLGVRYNFGAAVVNATYGTRKDENTTAAGVTTTVTDANITAVGVAVPLGAITVRASMYTGSDDRSTLTTDNTDLTGRQLSVTYSLSKRTLAYAAMGVNKVEQVGAATATAVGREVKGTNLGISHSF